MAGLKKLVAVTVAAVVLAAFAVYVLRPTTTPNAGNVVINEPNKPSSPAPDTSVSVKPHGPLVRPGWGTQPSSGPNSPPTRESGGPKHQVCVPPNSQIPEHSWTRGANWYRFYAGFDCGEFPGVRNGHS